MEDVHRRLIVVRHAKSAWPPGVPDRNRPLGPRGRADAQLVGARIRALVGPIDLAVISPAQRTQQTWELLAGPLGEVGGVRTDDRIYREWGAGLVHVVRSLPGEAATALVLGHEPGVSELVLAMADRGRPALREQIAAKFPTCAVAVLDTDRDWSEVAAGCARLAAFVTPRQLRADQ